MTADDIIAAARECLETPFRHQGRRIGQGLDCAGVVAHVADRLGLHYDAPTNYGRTPYRGLLEATLDAQTCLDRVQVMQAGDVLLMKWKAEPMHLAVWTGETVIHAYESVGKCVEHGLDAAWRARIVRAYRFRGVE